VTLYDQLLELAPNPVVALNRAVAIAELDGPVDALRLVQSLDLSGYYLYHSVLADIYLRLGRTAEAAESYDAAIALTENVTERAFLQRRRDALAH